MVCSAASGAAFGVIGTAPSAKEKQKRDNLLTKAEKSIPFQIF